MCAPILIRLRSVLAGDSSSPDWSGTWQALWILRDHGFSLSELTSVDLMNYPTGFGFVGATGNFVDLFLLGGLQCVFGPVAGYNLGVFCILIFMGYAVNRCVFRCTRSFALAALSIPIFMYSLPVWNEIHNGVYSHLIAIGTSAMALSEFGPLEKGDRGAALRLGLWGGITAVVQWYFGLMLCLVLVIPVLWAFARPVVERKRLFCLLAQAVVVGVAVVAIPLWFQARHVNDVPGVEGGFAGDMFPRDDARFEMIMLAAGSKRILPHDLLIRGWIPGIVVLLVVLGLFRKQTRETVLWWAVLLLAVVLSWGAYSGAPSLPGVQASRGVRLPYWYLSQIVPYLWRMIWVDRLSLFILLAALLLAMRSLGQWLNNAKIGRPQIAVTICGLLIVAESVGRHILPLPHRLEYVARSPKHRAAVDGMKALRDSFSGQAVVAYPGRGVMTQHHCYFQTLHQHPMLNTPKGLNRHPLPPELRGNPLLEALILEPDDHPPPIQPADTAALVAMGFQWVLIHTDLFDSVPAAFRSSPLGRCLEEGLGSPEEHGYLLIYRLSQNHSLGQHTVP